MSWDIVLFNSSEKISSPEELNETKLVPINFYTIIEANFKKINKTDNHCSISEDSFAIDYYYDNELASNIMLSLYCETAIYPIINLAIKNNWQIFDTALGAMIDLNNPSKNGYQNFSAYLAQILIKNQ